MNTKTAKALWCATCGTYRGTTDRPTDRPHINPHRPPWTPRFETAMCHDTETITDD